MVLTKIKRALIPVRMMGYYWTHRCKRWLDRCQRRFGKMLAPTICLLLGHQFQWVLTNVGMCQRCDKLIHLPW